MHFLKANIKKVSLSIMLTIMFIFWLFSYLSNKTILSIKLAYPMECILLILIGIYACITLSLLKENYYTLMMVAFVPFVYSHPFDAKTIPWSLFIAIILAFIGLIIRVIRFKFHFKIRPFFYGIVLLAIACLLGGIGNKAVFKSQIGLMLLFSIGLVLLFVYFSSENNCEFQDLALVFVFLGIYLTLQLCISYITQDNFVHTFIYKEISVGWGISNNIAIILLMLLPFTYYFILNKRGIFKIFYTLILIMETIAIFFTNSLGAISVVPILLLGLFIYGCVQTPYKKEFVVTQIMALCLIVAIILIILSIHNIPILKLFDRFIHNNLFTLHGRVKIYKDCFYHIKEHFWFGYGMFAPFSHHIDVSEGAYQWAHGTFFHTLYTLGFVGLLAMCFHLFEKYYILLKDHSMPAMISFFAFLGSGIYGLIDVSYYFINYMILLLLILIVTPTQVQFIHIQWKKEVKAHG